MKKIYFTDRLGIKIAANLHLPQNFFENEKYPAIIISGPAGCVKEQTAGLYSKKLAEKNFIALALDAPFQGESNGQPRFQERPFTRVEDIRSAADFLVTLNFVDDKKIAVLGICAGGGYAINAAMSERRIKAVALSTPVDGGREMRENPEIIKSLEMISEMRTAEARGGEKNIIAWMPDEYKNSADFDEKGGYDYYTDKKRGAGENWDNKMLFSSMDSVAMFDAFHLCEKFLTQPLCIVVGDKVGSFNALKDSKNLYERAASKDKKIFVLENVSHFDLYDNEKIVDSAVEKFAEFFNRVL